MRKAEYDFLTYTSFPSSVKLINDEVGQTAWWKTWVPYSLPVTPGSTLRTEVKIKQQDVINRPESRVILLGLKAGEWVGSKDLGLGYPFIGYVPLGTFDWTLFERTITVPDDVPTIRLAYAGGAGTPERTGLTWYDDLKIYQDDVFIYENKFSDWTPVGAVAGGIIGGVTGELTKPIGPISPLIGALGGVALGAGIGYALSQPATITTVTIPQIGPTPEQTYIVVK